MARTNTRFSLAIQLFIIILIFFFQQPHKTHESPATYAGKLTIVLQGTVDLGQLILTQALIIRDGLRTTKPFKREHKEKVVKLFLGSGLVSNSKIQETLARFGEINPHVDKGEKAKKAPSFKNKWNKLEKNLEQKMKEERKKHGVEVKNKPTPSMINIAGFPKEETPADICNLFKKNNCEFGNLLSLLSGS